MSSSKFQKKQQIAWKWMGRSITGIVEDIFFEPVVKEIKGKLIKRNGSIDKPAYLVKSNSGNYALKLETEIFDAVMDSLDKELDF